MSESISALPAQLFSQPAANAFVILDGASIPDLVAHVTHSAGCRSCCNSAKAC